MNRVSVIIPNYNREHLLGQTLANLLNQSQPPSEIIVVDDGSTDGSVAVIRSFGSAVKLLQQKNQGPGAARNAGLKIATGDYIQFQDSDDLISLNKLQSQKELLDVTGADIAFGPWAHVFIHEEKLILQTCVLQQALPSQKIKLSDWLLRGWFTVFQSLFFRRSFLSDTGSYKTGLSYGEDMEFLFRLVSRSPKIAFAPDTLTLYRLNSANNLSNKGGLSQVCRDIDWARCLLCIAQHERSLRTRSNPWSYNIFLTRVRKHLRHLQVEDVPSDVLDGLSGLVTNRRFLFLDGIELWLRVAERLRLSTCGHRWMRGLQAGPPNERQRRLISELGFQIEPTGK